MVSVQILYPYIHVTMLFASPGRSILGKTVPEAKTKGTLFPNGSFSLSCNKKVNQKPSSGYQ